MSNPCRYKKGQAGYIDPQKIIHGTTEEQLKWRATVAREIQNDIESERNYVMLESINKSVRGAIIAASIGAIAVLLTVLYQEYNRYRDNRDNRDRIPPEKIVELFIRVENIERLAVKTYDVSRSDYKVCKDVQYKVTEVHRKLSPEEYMDRFSRVRSGQ